MPVIRKDFGHFFAFDDAFGPAAKLHGHHLRAAPGILDGFNGVFGRQSSHNQCQLTGGCRLDRSPINPQHVFRGASTDGSLSQQTWCFSRIFPYSFGMTTKMTNKRQAI